MNLIMKVIIPVAGKGTRLRPHTYSKPKPLLHVAGKAVLGHLLDHFKDRPDVEEIIFITGDMDEQIKEYVAKHYTFKARYIKQESLNGDAGALYLAKDDISSDLLILYNDTMFYGDINNLKESEFDSIIWVKETDDPQRFGIVEVNGHTITNIVEKPDIPPSNLAIVGLYYFKDGAQLMQYIQRLFDENISTKGEYRLADALDLMVRDKVHFGMREVDEWLDTGKPETIISTNKWLLKHKFQKYTEYINTTIIEPVYIEDGVEIENSVIGPFVSIGKESKIKNSRIQDSILGNKTSVENVNMRESIVGFGAALKGKVNRFNIGDDSTIELH